MSLSLCWIVSFLECKSRGKSSSDIKGELNLSDLVNMDLALLWMGVPVHSGQELTFDAGAAIREGEPR